MKTKNDISFREQLFLSTIESNKQIIYKVCYMYAVDDDHFKDLYQEVLINLWQGLGEFRGDSQISTWIYRTSINTCVTFYRKDRKMGVRQPIEDLVDIPGDDGERLQLLKEMYRLVSRLNRIEKAIILMWLDEKSYEEISEITGLTRNNVASRLRRIKAKLVELGKE